MSGVRGFVVLSWLKSHFGSNGAINKALMESTYRLMTFKQLFRQLPQCAIGKKETLFPINLREVGLSID